MHQSKYLQVLSSIFIITLVISNIIAVKIGNFGGYFLPVAVIIFPLSYIIGDVVTEVYGYSVTRRMIWCGFMCNLVAVLAIWLGQIIPPAPFFDGQTAYERILGSTPRILGASFIAYLIGAFVNAFVLAKLKIKTKGKYLWVRTIGSTIIGQGLDSLFFISLAFIGAFPLFEIFTMILVQWAFKVWFEAVATPFTYAIVGYLKRKEHMNVFDENINFTPLKF